VSSPFKRAIVILADGARPDVLNQEMAAGHLPNLARLTEAGTNQSMLSCFPSTTGPAYLPYLTGCFPGTCHVPGIRWFDKSVYAKKGWGFKSFRSYCGPESMLLDSDMDPSIKTIFEQLPDSLSLLNGVTKGAGLRDLTRKTRLWLYYYAHLTDRWAYIDTEAKNRLCQAINERNFSYAFVVFPSVDEFSHRSSPFHPRVRQAYAEIDTHVGDIMNTLKKRGWLEDTLMTLVADHGLSETHSHFDIGPWLEKEKKKKTFYYTNIAKFRFEAASMVSGNGMTHLYFRGQKGWEGRQSFEEISHGSLILDELRFHSAVDLVVTQGADGAIHLQTERGHGWFYALPDGGLKYSFDKTGDPLGVFQQMPSASFSFDEGMSLTWDSHYPDVFRQMEQIFRSSRSGDIIVSAKSGFDLREKFEHPIHKASHGAICPEHMFVPLLMNYKLEETTIRSVDIFPTIMKLLGQEIPPALDGRCLV